MLYINQNTPKEIIVTANELSTVNPAYYTWLITSADTLQSYTFSAIDNSSSYYYNSFTLSVIPGATQGLTAGVIPTYTTGQHTYNIYQMQNYGDLNINNAVKLVETGLLYINGATLSINEYNGGNTVIPTYRG
jgi:hypothetical protein